ncbi:MAG TPA: aminoacyl-tRNA hydrolase [Thermopetrobacter sp.]|nr:aminoacyl-tRNA hydrolase [Thermopetrobacter sp.]
MKLIVGLGNPGGKYAGHRHNAGFMAVDAIARRHGFGPWRRRFSGEVAEGRLTGEKALLLKPLTYMNESGRAVAQAARFFKLSAEDVIVLHDELDLPPGRMRVKTGGGHAGHNGLRSIISHIGPDFHRVRIGIGHPGDKALVHSFVLHDFSRQERELVEPLIEAIAAHAPLLAAGEFATFANKVHLEVGE